MLSHSLDEYQQAMLMESYSVDDDRFATLSKMELSKIKMSIAYNKHVRPKYFVEGDLVWKTILPTGIKDPKYGKWSPNWKGPYIVSKVYSRRAYKLISMEGEEFDRKINGKYLKMYYPTIWEGYAKRSLTLIK